MMLDPYGKSLFRLICKQFVYLGFEIRDTGAKESIPVFIPESMKTSYPELDTKKQLAAIQFKGGPSRILKGEIEAVIVRFYLGTCDLLHISSVIERAHDYRSPLLSPNKDSYYNYTYPEINSDTINHIVELFEELEFQLLSYNDHKKLMNSFPHSISELPRY
ncbi:hypothetical protein [Neobacillus sp. Marseille-QA0830]